MAKTAQIGGISGLEIDSETAMALSSMDSGCFAVSVGGKPAFIVKDSAIAFLFGKDFEPGARFHFERIDRDEFPAVCAVIFVDAGKGDGFRYEYFFSLESEKDAEILARLARLKGVELWFLNGEGVPETGFDCVFDPEEKSKLEESCRPGV